MRWRGRNKGRERKKRERKRKEGRREGERKETNEPKETGLLLLNGSVINGAFLERTTTP